MTLTSKTLTQTIKKMKTILLVAALSIAGMTAHAQDEVWDASHNLKGYITKDGTIQDEHRNTLVQFHQSGQMTDVHSNTVGYIINDYELQDASHTTVGYILNNGNVEDEHHQLIGKINPEGTGPVKDQHSNVIGYIASTEPMWAAAYFFLLRY